MTTNQLWSIAEHVKDYQSRGWLLFPVSLGFKHPSIRGKAIKWGQYLDGSWNEFPEDHGLCVVTGKASRGLIVIDWDQEKFYYDYFGDSEKEHRQITRVDKTGKGMHSFFYSNKPVSAHRYIVPGSNNKIEILTDGIICVLPPTIHPDTGKPYEMISMTKEIATVDDLNETIDAILSKFGIESGGNNSPSGFTMEQVNKAGLKEGQGRNTAGYIKARSLLNPKEDGLESPKAWMSFQEWNQHNKDPMDLKEMETIFKSAEKGNKDPVKRQLVKENILDWIRASNVWATLEDSKEIHYYFEGIFVNGGETLIESMIRNSFPYIQSHDINEVILAIKGLSYIKREEFHKDPTMLPVRNGIVDVKKRVLVAFSPEYHFFAKLQTVFDPQAKCTEFLKFLRRAQPDTNGAGKTLMEMASTFLIPHIKIEKAYILQGVGNNGKTLFMNRIRNMLGSVNYSSLSLEKIVKGGFYSVRMLNKFGNLYSEISSSKIFDTSRFRSILSQEPIEIDEKYQPVFQVILRLRFMFSGNNLPEISDDHVGTWRRMFLIIFPIKFKEGVNDNLEDKLDSPQERSGFLNLCIANARQVLARYERGLNLFTHPQDSDEARNIWKEKSNNVYTFAKSEAVVFGTDYDVPALEFVEAYTKYCFDNQEPVKSAKFVYQTMLGSFGVPRRNTRRNNKENYYLIGVTLHSKLKDSKQSSFG